MSLPIHACQTPKKLSLKMLTSKLVKRTDRNTVLETIASVTISLSVPQIPELS